MRIRSSDIPQADRIESVVLLTLAVANGARTDIEIANQVPGIQGDSRQGRYYRKAAEILGFITNQQNNAQITEKGQQLAEDPNLSNPTLIASVLGLNLYQKLIPFLELHPEGVSRDDIMGYLGEIADPAIGPTMIPRRISTILGWIRSLGFTESVQGRIRLSNAIILSLPVMEIRDIDQPLLPTSGDLSEYEMVQERTERAVETVRIYKDMAKMDRANASHRRLVNLVAKRVRSAGAIPKSNVLVDLAASLEDDFIFEMKSSNDGNIRSQIRKGVSQLYEYRYLQNKPDAHLVLVVERPLSQSVSWMLDYLEIDRKIHLVWDGDDHLYSSQRTRERLNFLELI